MVDKLSEELDEFREAAASGDAVSIEDEIGDLLFTVTNVARHLKTDPEQALKKATAKFERRFKDVERRVIDDGLDMSEQSIDKLDEYWRQSKLALG